MTQYHVLNQPMIALSWYEAAAFCAWLNEQLDGALPPGYELRLPTEAEWEAAASSMPGAKRRIYPWGDEEPTIEQAITNENSNNRPAPVGTCPAGAAACGALDIAGNVWEWCATNKGEYPHSSVLAQKDFTERTRVPLRGGAYFHDRNRVSCGARIRNDPSLNGGLNGFRIVVAARSH